MNKTAIIMILMLAAMHVNAETFIPEGDINGTWTKAGSPYRIQGDITIAPDDSLLIEPGVVVDFEGHYKFLINGVLTAEGAIGDTIRFTRVTNDEFMNPDTVGLADTTFHNGSWNGIEWHAFHAAASSLSHCIVEYINTVDNSEATWDKHKAPIHFWDSKSLNLKNSVIRNNHGGRGGGIWAYNEVIIDSCLITNNRAYQIGGFEHRPAGGIHIYFSDLAEVTNCVITNNISDGSFSVGGIKIQAGSPLIMNNIISNNISSHSYRTAGGISCQVANPTIIQNLIVNNESRYTGGILYDGGGGRLYNNTICNNKSNSSMGGGITFRGASGTTVTNNIIYGNVNISDSLQIFLESNSTQPIVKSNLIGESILEIGGVDNGAIRESDNYFGDPLLLNPTGFPGIGDPSMPQDWQLTPGTFLINLGNNDPVNQFSIIKDMAGNRRINYGYVDPGCFELRIESYTPPSEINSPAIWIADTIHITGHTYLNAKVTIYPGVVILSEGHFDIFARDTLYAIGTAKAPILWTVKDTSGFSDPENHDGGWGSIGIDDTYPRIFRHCVFEFSKVNNYINGRVGLIWGYNNGNIEIDNCIFKDCQMIHASIIHSLRGVHLKVSSSIFYNNIVTASDAVILLHDGSNYMVRDNQLFNNNCTQRIISLRGANIDFINNSIYNNNGHVEFPQCFNFECINNTIVKNTRYPTPVGLGDNARFINCIIPDLSISQRNTWIISSYVPESLYEEAECIDLLSDPPIFNNPLPYSGIGPLEEILQADYSLSSISPGINYGTQDTSGLKLNKLDIAGNPRINDSRIDIGAYENQESLPVITSHPAGGTFCVDDQHLLKVEKEGSDTVIYNWFKDGVYVASQDKDNTLELKRIQISDEGNYHCEISNSYGKVLSSPVFIKVNTSPEILVQPEDTWHESGKNLSMSVVYTGSSPLHFQWEKDGKMILDEDLPEYRFTPVDSSQEGYYVCTISNTCDTVKTAPALLYLAPQICMVTVSTTTGHNLVVWEKQSKAPIMAYNIYRESVAAGIYDKLATISYDELSVLVDTIADPTVQAYLYKITAI
ncbi:immunoglobulin domain-containing protein, partial [Bacteroidota bacterium]